MKISILGEDYRITHDLKNSDHDGEVELLAKTIRIKPIEQIDGDGDAERIFIRDRAMRHEITHAFLDEAGLPEYSSDETLVEWVAAMMPKMADAMRAAGAL